ncbi:hypothetical protein BJ138DRAFT_1131203 [Hygrophoropsis aurantiaca]|uniref:Uncharacterized protein n=1 Tax=Hygrophoropsis aurantiaca TaxID=72124 RepID=A0ACB7ZSV5_9AGAM|nr:hypothetical protein BJ138DRAFT_1131203 [Hygrophoropsis aurantiaca]
MSMYLMLDWVEDIFILAMQAILVIRVYALFSRSKRVLIFLATCYALQATAVLVLAALSANRRAQSEYFVSIAPTIGTVVELFNVNDSAPAVLLALNITTVVFAFDGVLVFFALWVFARHALEGKTLDGGWSINVLVRTMAADHLIYFFCNLTWLSLHVVAGYLTEISDSIISLTFALNVFNVLAVIAGPRMVISLRQTEIKTRGEGGTLQGELSTIRFGVRDPPTQSEGTVVEGGGIQAMDGNV